MFTHIHSYIEQISELIKSPKIWLIATTINLLAIQSLQIFIEQYVFSEWHFAISFFLIFILDTISGSYIAWKKGDFQAKIFRDKLLDKCISYFTIIISFSAASKMVLDGSDVNLIRYLNLPFYSLFTAVELRSIVWKWYEFKHWPWLGRILSWIDKTKKLQIDDAG